LLKSSNQKKRFGGNEKVCNFALPIEKRAVRLDSSSGKKQFFSIVLSEASGPEIRNLLTYSLSCALFGGALKREKFFESLEATARSTFLSRTTLGKSTSE
jgi:hypothetical protein